MVEKTLRFPGHIQKIIEMRNNGLFKADKIEETAETLINEWMPGKEDYDQTIMRLEFHGVKDGEKVSEAYDLLDYYDKENYISSMARTTGYTCTAVADILLSNKFTQKGVYNLESLGSDNKIVDNILHYLAQRNVKFDKEV
jgi:saccharopine dehydrogenase-like NADP-dependent oxidoreductase